MPVQISVNGYRVSPARVTLGTAGSVTNETLVFSFSSEWDGLLKRITFRSCGHENAVPFFIPDDGVLPVPPQALAESGYHPAVIDGVGADGTVLYTVEIGFEVLYHPDAGTQPPPGYTRMNTSSLYSLFRMTVSWHRTQRRMHGTLRTLILTSNQAPGGSTIRTLASTWIPACPLQAPNRSSKRRLTKTLTTFLRISGYRKGDFDYGYKMGIS